MTRTGPFLASVLTTTGATGLAATGAALAVSAANDLSHTPADLDSAVAAVAGLLLGALLLVWSAGSAALVAAAVVGTAGSTGAALRAVADATTPLLLRRLLAAALGAAVLGGVAGPALAAEARATPPAGAAAPASASDLTWPAARGTAGPASSAPAPAASPSPTSSSPSSAAAGAEAPLSTGRPVPAPATGSPLVDPAEAPARTAVVVRSGDSLWSIAARHLPPGSTRAAVAAAWPRWYEANRAVIGSDPDHLRPGQRLVAP
ncbi:LysM peptidoglycan-binding domain-containing protein [Streptomyces sp. NP160]|uniref:LysM peptidoglycan-binding domain-containing protein n=1 Tax=Streptomyces sp. NP160 TaxID=2586637 RepID=UPI00214C8DDF|nr:LysM peptidoglycan-binding domain-containing protein [Streptomyces sp. NP160]